MKISTYIILALLSYCPIVLSTTIVPLPIDKQLKESDGVIHGIYIGKTYAVDREGSVVTRASFKILKSAGIGRSDLINKNSFVVNIPGGVWQGVRYQVHDAPKFKIGEEVVVLLSKTSFGYVVTNMSLGKYQVVKRNRHQYLISERFPKNPNIGRFTYKKFEELVEKVMDEHLDVITYDRKIIKTNKSIVKGSKGKGREIASTEDNSELVDEDSSVIWPVILFAILGFYSVLFSRKSKE